MPQDWHDNNAQDNDNSRPCVDAVSPHACIDALQHGTKVPRCTALIIAPPVTHSHRWRNVLPAFPASRPVTGILYGPQRAGTLQVWRLEPQPWPAVSTEHRSHSCSSHLAICRSSARQPPATVLAASLMYPKHLIYEKDCACNRI
jgi:hypothetical protein